MFWFVNDLKQYLINAGFPRTLIESLPWSDGKKAGARQLVNTLAPDPTWTTELFNLCVEVCRFQQFDHFDKSDDPDMRRGQAIKAINALKETCQSYLDQREQEDRQARAKLDREATIRASADRNSSYEELKKKFSILATMENKQQRGYALEKFMYDLFELEGLSPRPSFKIEAEQLDGFFELNDTHFIFEAKWTSTVDRNDLTLFDAKVGGKLDNTLGLFLSINGYQIPNLNSKWSARPKIILMDGQDLALVLEKRLSFAELIEGKKRHGSQTGEIFYPASRLI